MKGGSDGTEICILKLPLVVPVMRLNDLFLCEFVKFVNFPTVRALVAYSPYSLPNLGFEMHVPYTVWPDSDFGFAHYVIRQLCGITIHTLLATYLTLMRIYRMRSKHVFFHCTPPHSAEIMHLFLQIASQEAHLFCTRISNFFPIHELIAFMRRLVFALLD